MATNVKPLDSRTVAYLQRQQQLAMNTKCIQPPVDKSIISRISDALSDIDCMFQNNDALTKCRTSKY
jgi:hypothetical protein